MTPEEAYPDFYGNPVIRALAPLEKWTVSARKDLEGPANKRKVPLDMRELLDRGRVRGAWSFDGECLVSLDELSRSLPQAANAAFRLKATAAGVCVLDIEPTCPPEEALRLLSVPGCLWSELSMSGQGYHLLMPLPKNFWDFPAAMGKPALRHPSGHWEVLLDHWVTFTRRPVTLPASPGPSWEAVYAEVASLAKEAPTVSIEMNGEGLPPMSEDVLRAVLPFDHGKDPADYNGDMSRFEFAVIAAVYARVRGAVSAMRVYNEEREARGEEPVPDYTPSQLAALVAAVAEDCLEHRDKHDEVRSGMPYLLNRAMSMVALRLAEEEERDRTKKES